MIISLIVQIDYTFEEIQQLFLEDDFGGFLTRYTKSLSMLEFFEIGL
jgi:hypothetical protein